jgi:hypothetical protein
MGLQDVAEAIRDRFTDQVATPNSLTVHHDNAPPTALKVAASGIKGGRTRRPA